MNTMKKSKTILQESQEIIFERSEEKARDYGPIDQSFKDAATIASILTGKELTAEDCYKVMVGLKMARMKKAYKRDTYLDTVGYLGALANMLEGQEDALDKSLDINYDEEASE